MKSFKELQSELKKLVQNFGTLGNAADVLRGDPMFQNMDRSTLSRWCVSDKGGILVQYRIEHAINYLKSVTEEGQTLRKGYYYDSLDEIYTQLTDIVKKLKPLLKGLRTKKRRTE